VGSDVCVAVGIGVAELEMTEGGVA
jgi:hypothetical protein